MRGDLHKLLAFLSFKTTEEHRRPRSASIACARDAVLQVNNLPPHNGNGSLDKHFLNNIILRKPPRRQSQPVISKGLSRNKLGAVFTDSSTGFERRTVVSVNLDKSFIMKDFENEGRRKVWSSLQSKSIFTETSVQDGYLTTTLCSTEL